MGSLEDLKKKIMEEKYPLIMVVREDMATELVDLEENSLPEDLGVLGYAISGESGLAWLMEDGQYRIVPLTTKQVNKLIDNYYAHDSLPKFGGLRLKEVLNRGEGS